MAHSSIPHFHNQVGVRIIRVGSKEFMCIGAKPPFDHPHIFIDMGAGDDAICSYCGTVFQYTTALADGAADPESCLWDEHAPVA